MTRANIYLSPVTAAYGLSVSEQADAPNWARPGLSNAITRALKRLGPILTAMQPTLSPIERGYVESALESILPDVRPALPDDVETADRLPSAARIAAEIADAMPDLAEPGVRPQFVSWVAAWSPMEVWAMIEAMAGHPIAQAATEESARGRAGRPRKARPPKTQKAPHPGG